MNRFHWACVVLFAAAIPACTVGADENTNDTTNDTTNDPTDNDATALDQDPQPVSPSEIVTLDGVGTIVRGGVELSVPPPGLMVVHHVEFTDRAALSVTIRTELDGRVAILKDSTLATDGLLTFAGCTAKPKCEDSFYHLAISDSWNDYPWYHSSADMKSGWTAADLGAVASRAIANISNQDTSCAMADEVALPQRHLGVTSTAAKAADTDGKNVVGFRAGLAPGILAVTSSWWNVLGHRVESDIRINKDYNYYVGNVPAGCTNAYDLEGILTHEFGHVFNLDDLYDCSHANLVMYGYSFACQGKSRSLGRGDILGFRSRY